MAQRYGFEQFQQGEFMQDIVDQPTAEVKLLIDTDFGKGNEGSLGPATEAEVLSVKDIADQKYVEQMRAERWFCMDDGIEDLGGQLPGGILITEAAGATMQDKLEYHRQSDLIAAQTRELVGDGIEVWVHGDTHAGKIGCAANAGKRATLKIGRQHMESVIRLAWPTMEFLNLARVVPKETAREFILAGAARAENDDFWDVSPAEVVDIAVANGANYHEPDRQHRTACVRLDLSPNIYNNGKYRQTHQSHDGQPLGALSVTLGAYKDNLLRRAVKHGHNEIWVAQKVLQAAIFSVEASKKLGNERLRLAVVGTQH
jgi:hypothetical protein